MGTLASFASGHFRDGDRAGFAGPSPALMQHRSANRERTQTRPERGNRESTATTLRCLRSLAKARTGARQ
jgi:hypothetical protein